MLRYILEKNGFLYNLKVEYVSTEFAKNFDYKDEKDIDPQIIENIFKIDGTTKKSLESSASLTLTIKQFDQSVRCSRFRTIVPQLIKPKKIFQSAYPYQKEGINWLINNKKCILADDMGLGKTLQCLAALCEKFYSDLISQAVIFCPNNLLKTWGAEIRLWCPHLKFTEITSIDLRKDQTLKLFKNHNILLVPYSASNSFFNTISAEKLKIDVLIADEAHKLRNATSRVHNGFRKTKSDSSWFLTGTPLERDEKDIRNVLTLLFPEKAASMATLDSLFLKSNLNNNSLRRLKKDVLKQLPEVTKKIEWLELNKSDKDLYLETIKEMRKASSSDRIGFISKLVQVCCGAKNSKNIKIERATEITKEHQKLNKKVIIFSTFNAVLKSQRKSLNASNFESHLFNGELSTEVRQRNLADFLNSPNPCVLLANSNIASEGLTLTAASTVIFLNEWWNPSSNRQAEDRVNRIGQKENVLIYNLRAQKTIDENLSKILAVKVKLEKDFLDQLVSSMNE